MSNSTLVPAFILYFNGSRISIEREAEVKKIIVTDRLNAPSSFQIIVDDPVSQWCDDEYYYVGAEVKILMGYKDEVKPVILGEVLGISLQLRQNRSSQVIIRGTNHLHRLNHCKIHASYNGMTDKEIIEQLAGDGGIGTGEIESLTHEHKFTIQRNETGFEHLMALAERHDCYFWVKDKKLYFKRLKLNASEDLVLEYNKSLEELYPEVDTSRVVTEVEVRAWDYSAGEPIIGKAVFGDINSSGGAKVDENWGAHKEIKIDYLLTDQNSADELALDILTRNSRKYVNGRGSCEGNPDILAGTILKLEGLGEKFSGKYFLTSVSHQLKTDGAYETRFAFISDVASGNASSGSDEQSSENVEPQEQEDEVRKDKTREEEKQAIGFQCFDTMHNIIKGQKYLLITPDGERQGETDDQGVIVEEDITEGECTIKFYFNEDTEEAAELIEEKKYPTGRKHTLSFPTIELHLEIDPDDAESIDDQYILFSTDDNQYFKKTFTVKDDKIEGNDCVDLFYPGTETNLKYSLKIDPGAGGEPYFMFEDIPHEELKD